MQCNKTVRPGGFYSVTIESISNDEVSAYDLNKCMHTARLSDILYIKEEADTQLEIGEM